MNIKKKDHAVQKWCICGPAILLVPEQNKVINKSSADLINIATTVGVMMMMMKIINMATMIIRKNTILFHPYFCSIVLGLHDIQYIHLHVIKKGALNIIKIVCAGSKA